ncbi:beta-glucosidase family protein [Phenylobacterium sp.]|uniref:beta-glucosidase family protein n=1 Tax=Phenylobacterium sp. TaxID=1871053 RepID=UPI002FC64944
MKSLRATRLGAVSAISLIMAAPPAHAQGARPWLDPRLSPDERAALAEQAMTLDEKIAMLHGPMALPFPDPPPKEAIGGAGYIPGVPRLGIPALQETDASLGVTNPMNIRPDDGGTALPSGLAIAASFDADVARDGGAMVGREAFSKGFNVLLAGGANLAREPRNGRNFEYLGEDPLLAGTLGGAAIAGAQSSGVISTAKHFALNDQESARHGVDAQIDEAALRESDLLAFQLAIEIGKPGSIMCAYNKVNGDYACGSDFLLNRVLKGDWGYRGWVMSDWGATYGADFALKGLDQQSGQQLDKSVWFGDPLKQAVRSGQIPEARISDMVRRILRSMFAVGIVDRPPVKQAIDYTAHADVARRAAAEGVVLLKNRANLLPMAAGAKRIAVIGGGADAGVLSGGGSSSVTPPAGQGDPPRFVPVGGEGQMAPWWREVYHPSSPLKAIRALNKDAEVTFDTGRYASAAAAAAAKADVAIVFVTQWMTEGLDAADLTLPNGQDALVQAVIAANPNTIVVLETGGPIQMPWLDGAGAVVQAWYPGAKGGDAIADVLFGRVNPSGRLPMTFPQSVEQLPRPALIGFGGSERAAVAAPHPEGADVGYRWFAARGLKPLFPFGHGLSYTDFRYSDLTVAGGLTLTVSFTVENIGKTTGADVPQVYLATAAGEPAVRLIGFQKVRLAPGQRRTVTLKADPRLLARYDTQAGGWRLKGGRYQVRLAKDSASPGMTAGASVQAQLLKDRP